jgi:hypothetical protein
MALAAVHRHHADPVNLSVQSDPIGAPEPMSIEDVLAAPNGGSCAARHPSKVAHLGIGGNRSRCESTAARSCSLPIGDCRDVRPSG